MYTAQFIRWIISFAYSLKEHLTEKVEDTKELDELLTASELKYLVSRVSRVVTCIDTHQSKHASFGCIVFTADSYLCWALSFTREKKKEILILPRKKSQRIRGGLMQDPNSIF